MPIFISIIKAIIKNKINIQKITKPNAVIENIVEINGKSISIDYLGKMEESVEFLNFLGRKFKIA